jgi:hypothetical protein
LKALFYWPKRETLEENCQVPWLLNEYLHAKCYACSIHTNFQRVKFGREKGFSEPLQRWEKNMKVGHKCDVVGVKWIHVTQDWV